MAARCVWVMFIVLLTIKMQTTAGVKVLLVRDNSDYRSEEEASDTLSTEESDEIDFLIDLIKNEARASSPATTVRVIKRKPDVELVAQHSVRKEKVDPQPKTFKEYHVHYHNHQHKEPPKPLMTFEEDSLRPLMWESQLPMDFDSYKELQKSPSIPYSESARVKSFKDYETFLKSNLRSSYPTSEKFDPDIRIEAFKDFETFVKPKMASYRSKETTPFDRIKKFQDFLDSEEDKNEFLNKDRFAGFKDFSEIENPEPKAKSEEKSAPEHVEEEKTKLKIRDFAIVIKSKPRTSTQKKNMNTNKPDTQHINTQHDKDKIESPGPQIPPFVNKLRVPNDRPYDMPRVLEAAGGAPKYIDRINQLKYPQPDSFNMPYRHHFHVNGLEHDQRTFFHFRPMQQSPPVIPFRNHMNGWLLRRLMR